MRRDSLRASGMMAGIGVAACLEPSGGNSSFEPLLNEKNKTTTWMESCRIMIDALGFVTVTIHTTSAGQGHESLVATVVGEVLEINPDLIRVVRPDSLASLPSNTPVGSRMAIMLGGAAFHAAQKLRTKLIGIAAHQLGCEPDDLAYTDGGVSKDDNTALPWANLVNIAHRNFHLLPEGMEPGLEVTHVMQVPTGDKLPKDGRVQMYPCHSFEFHLVLIAFDPVIGKPEILRYVIGHDCGTVINPHIVKGMTLGGIAHGLGAALLEEFVYDAEGNIMTQSFMDYLLPSSTRSRKSRSCIIALRLHTPCSDRRDPARAAIWALRQPSPALSTTPYRPAASHSPNCRYGFRRSATPLPHPHSTKGNKE